MLSLQTRSRPAEGWKEQLEASLPFWDWVLQDMDEEEGLGTGVLLGRGLQRANVEKDGN